MAQLKISQLKKYLQSLSNEDLISNIIELFEKFSKVEEFYSVKLIDNGSLDLREKYKKIIKKEFFPDRGLGKMRLSLARKAINNFRKLSDNPYFIADLMIYYVEMGVAFTLEYGDINDPFYSSMESMYESAAKFVIKNKIKNDFLPRFQQILIDTNDMGWGFNDDLEYIYHKYFTEKITAPNNP